ncbi:GDSL esterase/lipase At2g40250-like [Typha latifolia]|uniref:GDSL esterase/lipase At2g40250-like n=1 Tax=Typha latifolia TaxID=4733 RepID=UPI003C2E6E37
MEKVNLAMDLFFFLLTIFSLFHHPVQALTHNISAVFAFGDSTLDPGNNNHLSTLIKANHPPYGRDFPGSAATGRFTDGKLITDYLVSSLQINDLLPPYYGYNFTTNEMPTGVSFASAGSGLDDLTAATSNVETIATQVENFEAYIEKMKGMLGEEKGDEILKNAMIIIGAGSNDLIMNYYLLPSRRSSFTLAQYHAFLIEKLQSLIQQLYAMGIRKFAVAGLPPIGCLPLQMTLSGISSNITPHPRACIADQNAAASSYNSDLQTMIQKLQSAPGWQKPLVKIAYVDIYNPLMDMVQNPIKYGFTETTRGCCGTGLVEMGPLCNSQAMTCPSPSTFMFWDSVHPSQAAYEALANLLTLTVLPQLED